MMERAIQVAHEEFEDMPKRPVLKVKRHAWCTSEKCNPQSLNKGKSKPQSGGVFCVDCGNALYYECLALT